jgi:hypothetical protein
MELEVPGGIILVVAGALLILILVPGIAGTLDTLIQPRSFSLERWPRKTKVIIFSFGICFLVLGLVILLIPLLPSQTGVGTPTVFSPRTATVEPTEALALIQRIDFDYQDSPTEHGWKIIHHRPDSKRSGGDSPG